MKISACLIVKNEEKYLERCLNSIYKYVDEIIITDTGSTDKTLEIAKKYTDKIYFYQWIDDFASARNFCQSHANGDYILRIDADEYFHEKDISRLLEEVNFSNDIDTFDIIMNYIDQNTKNHKNYPCCVLFKKSLSWKWKVHEVLDIKNKHTSRFLPQVIIQHTSIKSDKPWRDEEKLLENFIEQPENITIFVLLINNYLFHKNFEKINYLLDLLWSIDYFYIKNIIQIRQKLLEISEIHIKILDQKIKQSIITNKNNNS